MAARMVMGKTEEGTGTGDLGEEKGEPAVGLGEGGSPGAWGQNRALPLAAAAASEGGMAATCAAGSEGCIQARCGLFPLANTGGHAHVPPRYRFAPHAAAQALAEHMAGTCRPLAPRCQLRFFRECVPPRPPLWPGTGTSSGTGTSRAAQPAAPSTVPSTLSRPDPGGTGQRALHPPVAAPMAGLVRAFSCSRHPMATGPWRGYRRGTMSSGAEQQWVAPQRRACRYPSRYQIALAGCSAPPSALLAS